jgi:hypothetical protein
MRKAKDKKIDIREIVYSQDDEKSFGDIFVYEPENVEEQNLGSLFIVGELRDLPRNSSYVVNLIASKIKKEFYANTKRGSENSLEAALAAANQTFSELAHQGNGEYVSRLSMVCGTYRDNKFFLSQVGRIRSLLVRDEHLVEIVREEDSKPATPQRAFNNIASGELIEGDAVIFATSGLFNICSLEELRQMASSLDLDELAAKLQEEVEEEDSEVVSALLMEVSGGKKKEKLRRVEAVLEQEPEVLAEPEPAAVAAAEGLPQAMAEEAAVAAAKEAVPAAEIEGEVEAVETERLNDRDIDLAGKDSEKISLSDVIREYERIENKDADGGEEKEKSIENIIGRKNGTDFQDLDERKQRMEGPAGSWAPRARAFVAGLSLEGAKAHLRSLGGKLPSSPKEYRIKSMGGKLGKLSGKKALVAAVAVVLVLVVAYPTLSGDKAAKDKAELYLALLTDAQSKLDQAQNSGSGKDAFEAKTIAERVKSEYGQFGAQADTIIAKSTSELEMIDKVVKADSLQSVAAFDNADIKQMVEIAGNYYAIDSKANAVYKVDAKNAKLTLLATASHPLGEIKQAQSFQNQEILMTDGTAFSSFGLQSKAITASASPMDAAVSGFTTYNRNIYVLSPSQNQIYKYQKGADGLSGKSEWLKSGDVKNAVSMAIDQNIFVLYSDGSVKKFYTGAESAEGFAITQPSDAITDATRIFTLGDHKNLYILEPAKKRVLVFDKVGGQLSKQYVSEEFSGARDFSVDAKETTLTLLLAGKIVKVSL